MKNRTTKLAATIALTATTLLTTTTTSSATQISDCTVTIKNQHSIHEGTTVIAKIGDKKIGSIHNVESEKNKVTTKTFKNVQADLIDFNTVIPGPDNITSLNTQNLVCVPILKPETEIVVKEVPVEVIKEVVKEVPVEVEVIKEVIKEVPVRAAAPQPQASSPLPEAPVASPVVETPRYNG